MNKKIGALVIFLIICGLFIFIVPSFTPSDLFNRGAEDTTTDGTVITEAEVLSLINLERSYAQVAPLTRASALTSSAQVKLDDMEAQQYFEHLSPQGTDVSDLANRSGYEFIVVGENLAVGPFSNAKDLVAAWMASPGHRENILNASYLDTGIAVERVVYFGQEQWMAVEHFGTSASECPKVDPQLKEKIDEDDAVLKLEGKALDELEKEIQGLKNSDPEKTNKVIEYNLKVNTYNALLKILAANTSAYNLSVQKFNSCASQFSVGE